MAGSNYDVNIKLDVRKINQQISNLERRISKLNALAQGKKGDSKTLLKNERDKAALLLKQERTQKRVNKELEKTNRLKKEELNLTKRATGKGSGGTSTSTSAIQRQRQRDFDIARGKFAGSGPNVYGPQPRKPRFTSGDISGALISGAFPLLFGQGPLGAAAGFGGGLIGSKIGGQTGGFAGGLVATALLTQAQQLFDSTAKLGQAFNILTPNVEGLTRALGANGTEREKQIQLIKKTEGTQAALAAVTEQMNQQIGEKGVKNLKEFGENTRLIGNAFQLLGTKMLAALAPVLNLLANPIKVEAARAETNRLANVGGAADDPELQALQAKIDGNYEEVLLAQELDAKIKEMIEDGATMEELDVKKIENLLKQNNALEKQAEQAEKVRQQFKSLGQSLATDVADGLQGLIRGTSTLSDMLTNVVNKLIDAAFNMALFGNPGGQLGSGGLFGTVISGFGSLFGGGGGPTMGKGGYFDPITGKGIAGPNFGLANGGTARAGNTYMVGERGPELFNPGVSGTITPNHALGGSTNIVVNVDASGSSVEGDEQGGRELGRMISAAIQSELLTQKRPGGLLA